LKDTQARHESVVNSLKSQHESTLKQLHDDFASASALARHEAEVNKATALKQQTEKLTNDHESMVGVLNSRHKDEVDRWERKLEEVKLALKSALDRGDGLAEQLTRTKEQFASAIEQAAADLRLTIARHEVRTSFRTMIFTVCVSY
jgi:predicted mannosyl-3-phosphoglycerate phosphatase (HAD superfamily)